MPNSKGISNYDFIKVISKFSKKEISGFNKMLRSPLYNNHSTLLTLFTELRKYHPGFENKILTKEYLYGIVNPGKNYNDILFRKYLSRLYKLAEAFLDLSERSTIPIEYELNIMQQLSKRNIDDIFERKKKEIYKKFIYKRKLKYDNFYFLHKLSEIKGYQSAKKNSSRERQNELLDSTTHIFIHFLSLACINTGQFETDSVTFKSVYGTEYAHSVLKFIDIEFCLNELIKSRNKRALNKNDIILIEIISNDFKLNIPNEKKSSYGKLRSLVNKNIDLIDKNYLLYLLKRMNTFCISEQLKNNSDYDKDLFENYKYIMEHRLFSLEGTPSLNLNDFKAILYSATRSNELEWLKNFIKEYKEQFGFISGDEIYNYGMAYLSFYKKEYELSLEYLAKISIRQFVFTLDSYILKSKIYFEMGFRKSSISVSNAFRHYLNNNKSMSEELKSGLINYLKYYKILLSLKGKNNSERSYKILNEIKESSVLRNKVWLTEKAKELT
ncbi:MAG TPA: hypothetical protein PKA90_02410 [Ignavibacteria bacterium]|nr:hypothetical protein [Ignavibacteria bacterium]HMR39260.1 hypothetical protein [Ignavibacteria bacterium]